MIKITILMEENRSSFDRYRCNQAINNTSDPNSFTLKILINFGC